MRLGDILEILAAALFVATGFLYVGLVLALLIGGVCLAYFAQNFDFVLRRPERPRLTRRNPPKEERTVAVFHCAYCGTDSPADQPHQCADALSSP